MVLDVCMVHLGRDLEADCVGMWMVNMGCIRMEGRKIYYIPWFSDL